MSGKILNKPKIIALGYFDSVHKGHAEILAKTVEIAKLLNAESCAYIFKDFGLKKDNVFTTSERESRIKAQGVDNVIIAEFDEKIKNTTAEDFLNGLIKTQNILGFVCGYDYTYGVNRGGNCSTLQQFAFSNGLYYACIDKVCVNGEKISTTLIKNYLKNGEMELANSLLTENYSITGVVSHGNAIGRTIDFPTINIPLQDNKMLIKKGVYGGSCRLFGKTYKAIINLGAKPTVDGKTNGVEAFLIGFDGDVYGETVTISFDKFIREIKKFDNLEQLKTQLELDRSVYD